MEVLAPNLPLVGAGAFEPHVADSGLIEGLVHGLERRVEEIAPAAADPEQLVLFVKRSRVRERSPE